MHVQSHGKRIAGKTFALLFLILLFVIMVFPFIVIVLNSFKTAQDFAANGPLAWPKPWSAGAIVTFWNRVNYGQKLWNSFSISLVVAVVAVILSLLNAFSLGIGRIKGSVVFLILFVIANTLPQEVLVYPLYYMAKLFGIYDRKISVIIIFTAIQSAFGTYLLSSAYHAFPVSCWKRQRSTGAPKGSF